MTRPRPVLCALALAAWATTAATHVHAQNLFVANVFGGSNHQGDVTEFSTSGGTLDPATAHVVATSNNTNGLNEPESMVFDAAGNLFLGGDYGGSGTPKPAAITEFTNSGGTLNPTGKVFASYSSPDDIFGLAFDSGGDLFAANNGSNSITEYAASGGTLNSTPTVFANSTSNTTGGLNGPCGLAFDRAGDLFVANQGNSFGIGITANTTGTIVEFTNSGGILSSVGTVFATRSSTNGLFFPSGLTFDATGNLFVSDANGITEFNATKGVLDAASGHIFAPISSSVLNAPVGLAFDPSGNLFVGNGNSGGPGRISEFTASGGVLDPASGKVVAENFPEQGDITPASLAFSPSPVPEISTVPAFAMFCLVGLGVMLRSRKRSATPKPGL